MKTIFLIVLSTLSMIGFAQNKIIKKYEYNRINQLGQIDTFRLYYIIDSSKSIKNKGLVLYALTISTDSLDVTGFVKVDKKEKRTYFISKHFNEKKSICKSYNQKQEVFRFTNNFTTRYICYFGYVGSYIKMKTSLTKNKDFRIKIVYENPIPSEEIFIRNLEFRRNNMNYPASITFYDPVLEKELICIAK